MTRMIGKLTTLCLLSALAVAPALPAVAATRTEVKRMVLEEAANSNVPPALAMAVAKAESDFLATALSTAGARGVMQIMPKTARGVFGVDADELWDPRLNIRLGIDFLEQLYEQYGGRWELALSHYNGGTLRGGRGADAKPHGYTRKYVAGVMNWWRTYDEQARVWAAIDGVPLADGTVQLASAGPAAAGSDAAADPRRPRAVVRWQDGASPMASDFNRSGFWDRLAAVRRSLDDFSLPRIGRSGG